MNKLQILVLGLDTFARKNIQQIVALGARNCCFDIVTNDQRGDSRSVFGSIPQDQSRLFVSCGSLLARIRLAWSLMRRNRYDVVELYSAGRMALFYLIMLLLRRQRFVVVERGDIGILEEHDRLTRAIIKAAYRLATVILYKETYMEEPLKAATRAPLHFVPNCIAAPELPLTPHGQRPIDFLWVNRIVPQRRPGWIIRAMRTEPLQSKRLVVLGTEERSNLPEHLRVEQEAVVDDCPPNVDIRGFIDPNRFYEQARFFCLPATVVFGNNSLLEAMSRGVVPVVTEAPGVELMIKHGVSGIVTAFAEEDYQAGLVKAAALSPDQWASMSAAAVATVRDHYSVEAWTSKMMTVYRFVAS